jgi:hypothetical protein
VLRREEAPTLVAPVRTERPAVARNERTGYNADDLEIPSFLRRK